MYRIIITATILLLVAAANFYHIVSFFSRKTLEIQESGEIPCEFLGDFNYSGMSRACYFHNQDSLEKRQLVKEHVPILNFSRDVNYDQYDLVVSFGREIESIYYGADMFKGKYIPYYSFRSGFKKDIVYFYLVIKDTSVADDREYPLG
jgi:hypothetical protein